MADGVVEGQAGAAEAAHVKTLPHIALRLLLLGGACTRDMQVPGQMWSEG